MLALAAAPAWASNIVIANDDGLTSNVKALYEALKAEGHDVIVSVPCTGQSGMGGALKILRPLGPLAEDCLAGAASAGDPGAGPMTRAGFGQDWFYVNGTPVMALLYGLDVQAQARWGKAPDLVLSGPNEGQNVGYIVISSGTVSNVQYAAIRGIPAIALSAGDKTADTATLANPESRKVAALSLRLVRELVARAGGKGPLLPPGTALNVNFPDQLDGDPQWRLTRIGTYNAYDVRFAADLSQDPTARAYGLGKIALPGLTMRRAEGAGSAAQAADESLVVRDAIAVSPIQIAYDPPAASRRWLRKRLGKFLKD